MFYLQFIPHKMVSTIQGNREAMHMNIFSSSHRRPTHTNHRHNRPHVGHISDTSSTERSSEGGFSRVFTAALFALPVTAVIGLVLLLIVTAVAYANPDPDSLTTPLSMAVLGLSSLLGGLVAARRGQHKPLLCGGMLGLLFVLLLLVGSLFFSDEARESLTLGLPTPLLWGLHGGVVLLSALGGKLGSRRSTPNRRSRKRS